jgi:hypothetical protein
MLPPFLHVLGVWCVNIQSHARKLFSLRVALDVLAVRFPRRASYSKGEKFFDYSSPRVGTVAAATVRTPGTEVQRSGRRGDQTLPSMSLREVQILLGLGIISAPGRVDLSAVVSSFVKIVCNGPIRPDDERMIRGEIRRPGYGLFDRALGASYLPGLHKAARKTTA